MIKKGRGFGKKGVDVETLAPWMIALGFLILMATGYFILKGKGIGAIDYFKNFLRFGR